jgi:hypothetical protein
LPADTSEVPVLKASWRLVDHKGSGFFYYCTVADEDHKVQPAPDSVTALASKATQMLQMQRIYGVRHTPMRRKMGDRRAVLCVQLLAGTNADQAQRTLDQALEASPLRLSESLDLLPTATPVAIPQSRSRRGKGQMPFRRPLVPLAR